MLTTTDTDGNLRSRPMGYKQGDSDSKSELWLVEYFFLYIKFLYIILGFSHEQIHQKYMKSSEIQK